MRVAVVGAGALGRGYGAALQSVGCDVVWVARKAAPRAAFYVERAGLFSRQRELHTELLAELPRCDLALVTLRAEDVTEALLSALHGLERPVVLLSPLVSSAVAERWSALPLLVPATPSLVAEWMPPTLHAWVPPLSVTWLDASGQRFETVQKFAELLSQAGIRTRFGRQVLLQSRVTTMLFFPGQQALRCKPHINTWRQQPGWLSRVARGFQLSRKLVANQGVFPGLSLRLAAYVLSFTPALYLLSVLLPLLVPRLARFLEHHFGHKLQAQTAQFETEMTRAARTAGWPEGDVSALRLDAAPSTRNDSEQHS
jgi:hypothetical protein